MSDWYDGEEDDAEIVDADNRWVARQRLEDSQPGHTQASATSAIQAPRRTWINPYEALLDEVSRTNAYVVLLGIQVDEWDATGGAHRHKNARPLLARYERERDRLIAVCSKAISLGIAERHVRIAEKEGEIMAGVVTRAIDAAGLTPDQRRTVLTEIAAGIRANTVHIPVPAVT